ncbi:hypothetical protein FMEXI_11829 [Fusarium mexicanum]|uniref:Uncharacterized protein n=1 Tax=Fusarium mexicanum TaxID=751941 RepID=A0A8H5IAG5_9HYPO|nr:hypothetical protein FMEXI_11829 [Fusarium mexicanum]
MTPRSIHSVTCECFTRRSDRLYFFTIAIAPIDSTLPATIPQSANGIQQPLLKPEFCTSFVIPNATVLSTTQSHDLRRLANQTIHCPPSRAFEPLADDNPVRVLEAFVEPLMPSLPNQLSELYVNETPNDFMKLDRQIGPITGEINPAANRV